MAESRKLKQVVSKMKRYKLDILGISETRWKEFGTLTTNDAFMLLYPGTQTENEHINRVGILLIKAASKSLLEWYPVSERIITAQFKIKIRNIKIIQCYSLIEPSVTETKLEFYHKLNETMR
jgi:hypothetical protein